MVDGHILKLTASYSGPHPSGWDHDYEPLEPKEEWPTYENMVSKFKELTGLAQPGDPLDQLLAAVNEDGPPAETRNVNVYSSPSKGWVTAQVEVNINKKGRMGLTVADKQDTASTASLLLLPPIATPTVDGSQVDAGIETDVTLVQPDIEQPIEETGDNLMTANPQNNDRKVWTAEFIIQLIKEIVTAVLGLAIVIYTLILAYNTVLLAGSPKIGDAKDVLMLMLGLAGVVVGYYFGRVPADARATQAQEQANDASAQAEQVNAQAQAIAGQVDKMLDKVAPATTEAATRGVGAPQIDESVTRDLQRIRDELRAIS